MNLRRMKFVRFLVIAYLLNKKAKVLPPHGGKMTSTMAETEVGIVGAAPGSEPKNMWSLISQPPQSKDRIEKVQTFIYGKSEIASTESTKLKFEAYADTDLYSEVLIHLRGAMRVKPNKGTIWGKAGDKEAQLRYNMKKYGVVNYLPQMMLKKVTVIANGTDISDSSDTPYPFMMNFESLINYPQEFKDNILSVTANYKDDIDYDGQFEFRPMYKRSEKDSDFLPQLPPDDWDENDGNDGVELGEENEDLLQASESTNGNSENTSKDKKVAKSVTGGQPPPPQQQVPVASGAGVQDPNEVVEEYLIPKGANERFLRLQGWTQWQIPLHIDLMTLDRPLPPKIHLVITCQFMEDNFLFTMADMSLPKPTLEISSKVEMTIDKYTPPPGTARQQTGFMPIMRRRLKNASMPKGLTDLSWDEMWKGSELPSTVLVALVPQMAADGHWQRNPFYWTMPKITEACLILNGAEYEPAQKLSNTRGDFDEQGALDMYLHVQKNCGMNYRTRQCVNLSFERWKNGCFFLAFDRSKSKDNSFHMPSTDNGRLGLRLKLAEPIPEIMKIYTYGIFPSYLRIASNGDVDYPVNV